MSYVEWKQTNLIHTCRKCMRVFVWNKVGEWERTICPHCKTPMSQDDQDASRRRMTCR